MWKKEDKNFSDFFKKKPTDKIWWTIALGQRGNMYFSFDKENIYQLFGDYPRNLTEEQLKIFNEENPYWRDFFNGVPVDEDDDDYE